MISGDLVRLRGIEQADEAVLGALRNDMELQLALMARPRPSGTPRIRKWLDRTSEDPSKVFFVVADLATGDAVGFIQLAGLDIESRHARLGICLTREVWGRGYATEAIRLLLNYSYCVLGLRKVLLEVLASNERAITTYERAGFRVIGRLLSHFYSDGSFHDVVMMERLIGADGAADR